MTARLECEGLTGGRGSTVAFRDVDLTVDEGAVVALLGPNGAGKTTLLLTVAGLLPATRGRVSVDGETVPTGRAAHANRAGIVLVPDDRCLFPPLTTEENLQVAARRGGPKPRDLLSTFPALERRWRVPAGALSGGEQQMLAMARALIQEPKVLLVDELSMGLAPMIVETLFQAVERITAEHRCAVVLVEQHVTIALEVADRAIVLNRGAIVLEGTASDLAGRTSDLELAYFGSGAGTA
jgi:branched-chain amino acid transport system ATP-binding protein